MSREELHGSWNEECNAYIYYLKGSENPLKKYRKRNTSRDSLEKKDEKNKNDLIIERMKKMGQLPIIDHANHQETSKNIFQRYFMKK